MEQGKQITNSLLLSDSLSLEERPFEEAKDVDHEFEIVKTSENVDEKLVMKVLGDNRFYLKFILEFTRTQQFKIWLNSFSLNISCLNPMHPYQENV